MVIKMGDDAKVTLGAVELQLGFNVDHLTNLRLTTFYVSKVYSYLAYVLPNNNDKDEDLKILQDLLNELYEMQVNIKIGNGVDREQWKTNLAKLGKIQAQTSNIAVKNDMIKYEQAQFGTFK